MFGLLDWKKIEMRKYLIVIMLVFVAMFAAVPGNVYAQSPANYTAEYGVTNFYTDDAVLEYHFAGLDVTEHYQWVMRGINQDGTPGEIISVKNSLGSAAVTITWTSLAGDFLLANGLPHVGAAEVADHFGQIQGVHFMLPGCNLILSLECSNADWLQGGAAVSSPLARVGIGPSMNQFPLNADGYFHIYTDPVSVLTRQGGVSFLHFKFLVGSVDEFRIYNKNSPAVAYTISHEDLEAYNTDDRNSVLTPYNPTNSFVVLNTNGVRPQYINRVQDLIAWSNGDNPHTLQVPTGAYDYTYHDSFGVWVADGESTWLVGNNPTIEFWSVSVQEHVSESGQLRQTFISETLGIWESGYINHELNDSLMGLIDSDDYAYAKRRSYEYTVFGVQTDDVLSTWSIHPTLSNLNTATLSDRRWDIELLYNIDQTISIADRAENTLNQLGWDTPLGRTLAMLILMMSVFYALARNGARSIYGYALTFLVIGGGWIAIGLGDGLSTLLFGISAIVLVWTMIGMRSSNEGAGM